MIHRANEWNPQSWARIGGVLYFVIIVAGIFGEAFVRGQVTDGVVTIATAGNAAAPGSLLRIGFVTDLIMFACDVAVTLILYMLLRPVARGLALLAAFFRLVSDAVQSINMLHQFAVVLLVGGADYLNAFTPGQLRALALLFLKLQGFGNLIGLTFFSFNCFVTGYLIFRSRFLPRWIGILLAFAGLCYLANSFASFLAPGIAALLFPAILMPALVAELSLCLWLLVKGVGTRYGAIKAGEPAS